MRSLSVGLLVACLAWTGPVLAVPQQEPLPPPAAAPGTVTIDNFNNATTATVTFNDGAGDSGTVSTLLSQMLVTYMNGDYTTASFDTFCFDLLHTVIVGQSYLVAARGDLAAVHGNGSRAAYILENYGLGDLTSSPDQAAAVQIALWDLSMNNHDPTSFASDGGTHYSSGDPGVFSVDLGGNPDAATIAGLVNDYLVASIGASNTGDWLDGAAGSGSDRGQSLLIPSPFFVVPGTTDIEPTNTAPPTFRASEPGSTLIFAAGLAALAGLRQRRRPPKLLSWQPSGG